MDAFETLVAEILESKGYWVQQSVKVKLSAEEKTKINRPSCPRWEIDLVAYRPRSNELIAVECKSYLDSRGVDLTHLLGGPHAKRYKLFTEPNLRMVILNRLLAQLQDQGLVHGSPEVRLAMAIGKIAGDPAALKRHFEQNGWLLFDTASLHTDLERLAKDGYVDSVASIVAKLLLRTRKK
jgi:hypothetical protein